MNKWKPKAAAAHLESLIRRERTAGRSTEAGALAIAMIIDQVWCSPTLFERALRDALNYTPDEAADVRTLVSSTEDIDEDDACEHCGLVMSIPDVQIPFRLTEKSDAG